jgi:hypothetical protein
MTHMYDEKREEDDNILLIQMNFVNHSFDFLESLFSLQFS